MRVVVAQVYTNLFEGEALSVSAPTTEGVVTILARHEPFVATLKRGMLVVRTATGEQVFEVDSGVIETSANQVTVLV